jgi:hypothetical protein
MPQTPTGPQQGPRPQRYWPDEPVSTHPPSERIAGSTTALTGSGRCRAAGRPRHEGSGQSPPRRYIRSVRWRSYARRGEKVNGSLARPNAAARQANVSSQGVCREALPVLADRRPRPPSSTLPRGNDGISPGAHAAQTLESTGRAEVPHHRRSAATKHRCNQLVSLRTIFDGAALARASTTVSPAKGRAAGIAGASVVGVELHMHRDVDVCSIGNDELTAVLLLRQQCGHAAQPAPGLWNGRGAALPRRARRPLHPPGGAESCTLARPAPRSPTNNRRLAWAGRCLPDGG